MNKPSDINKKVDQTLDSLDGIQRAEPQPFFYTRLLGRLQRNEKTLWETMGSFLSRPVVVVICLCFILVFNAFILFRQDSGTNTTPTATETPLVTDNEYILASNSSFDYENLDQQ
jgi:hypothetical protein